MKEIWKFWKEYGVSRLYKKGSKLYVSNLGRVRADDNIVEMKPNKCGYIVLCRKFVHRIVYELFVGKIPEGYEIDHIDTNRSNNRLDNLRCVTRKENNNNPLTKKHNSESRKGKTGEKCPNSKPIHQIDKKTGQVIKTWPCAIEVKKQLGISCGNISECCSGKRKSTGGYIWKYA